MSTPVAARRAAQWGSPAQRSSRRIRLARTGTPGTPGTSSRIRVLTPPTPFTGAPGRLTPATGAADTFGHDVSSNFARLLRLTRTAPHLLRAVLDLGLVGERVLKPVVRRLADGVTAAASGALSAADWARLGDLRDTALQSSVLHVRAALIAPALAPSPTDNIVVLPSSVEHLVCQFERLAAAAPAPVPAVTWQNDDEAAETAGAAADGPAVDFATAPPACVAVALRQRAARSRAAGARGPVHRSTSSDSSSEGASGGSGCGPAAPPATIAEMLVSKLKVECVRQLRRALSERDAEGSVPSTYVGRYAQGLLGGIWGLLEAVPPAGASDALLERAVDLEYFAPGGGEVKRRPAVGEPAAGVAAGAPRGRLSHIAESAEEGAEEPSPARGGAGDAAPPGASPAAATPGAAPPREKRKREASAVGSLGVLQLMGAKGSRRGKYVSHRALRNKIQRGKATRAVERLARERRDGEEEAPALFAGTVMEGGGAEAATAAKEAGSPGRGGEGSGGREAPQGGAGGEAAPPPPPPPARRARSLGGDGAAAALAPATRRRRRSDPGIAVHA